MYQCPVCGELLEALTNVHCLSKHQCTRDDFIARHGAPKFVAPKLSREIQRWIRESQVITRLDYEIAQASARNQLGRRY
ncbi:MAG: hypothetical protein K6T63_02855 [Alicyclobacillus herbarius]|jgi:hypothetical protein|uniref:hypothetical protein n=1 Tax=Alicyclobacillus TaxID=29330 RepID=UPI000414287B|nr:MULTISPECIES: hypothetical protein [Alicyclobacillus]MCL6625948.1 hypothetical protein [Alicyclobacillus shizuokensis]MCL6631546.1 hypothetical protein [Alicyclobacillus herbarius]